MGLIWTGEAKTSPIITKPHQPFAECKITLHSISQNTQNEFLHSSQTESKPELMRVKHREAGELPTAASIKFFVCKKQN